MKAHMRTEQDAVSERSGYALYRGAVHTSLTDP